MRVGGNSASLSRRNVVTLPNGFRWIREDDASVKFKCDEPRMDRYSLYDYYCWSLEADSLVIVQDVEGSLVGVLQLTIHKNYLTIEMVARNKLFNYPGVGLNLIKVVELYVAPQLRIREVRLEALQELVPYYDDTLGYHEYIAAYYDEAWGYLTPKRKFLASAA